MVGVLREEAVLEAADDVLVGNDGNGGSHLEETSGVGPQGLVQLLLRLGQIMTSTCSDLRSIGKGEINLAGSLVDSLGGPLSHPV
jgi:hypothetical protein